MCVRPLLQTKLNLIRKSLESSGEVVKVKSSKEHDCFIMASGRLNKAVIIGIAFETLTAFKINIQRWSWAEAEGFTLDDIVDKLGSEIFEKIDPNSVVAYMLEK
jgi:hypothetical protein